ncbi:MAG: 50S ribosomal protein L25/general stress protein Ctc [Sphingobacteriales bacterium JAD_PAG50586_3]|nr:MAG: 50S ribosomal protein L25/general stress protein Ctc [Sphingobacteriales bacterium JAD_PAG50586_3]
MKTATISGSPRTGLGKKDTKAIRNQGLVPCVLYGAADQVHFAADSREFKKVLFTPEVFTIDLAIDGKNYKATLQDTQFHPISDELIHADFLAINDATPISIAIPVKVTGNSVGVRAGGKLVIKTRKVRVKALPANLPDSINVDISDLSIGQSVKIQDLKIENVTILAAPNVVLVSVNTTRAAQAAATEAAKAGKK